MPKRLRKRRQQEGDDPTESAFRVLQHVIQQTEGGTTKPARKNVVPITSRRRKDPAAVALGRRGGLKSAKARMKKIDPAERRRIAIQAARARWDRAKRKGGD